MALLSLNFHDHNASVSLFMQLVQEGKSFDVVTGKVSGTGTGLPSKLYSFWQPVMYIMTTKDRKEKILLFFHQGSFIQNSFLLKYTKDLHGLNSPFYCENGNKKTADIAAV
jgi:hypothetical protein